MICVAKCFGCLQKNKTFENLSDHKCCVNENLGTYFRCIDGLQQKRWYARETYLRHKLNIKTLSDKSLKKLSSA